MGPAEMKVLALGSVLSLEKNKGLATQRPRKAGSFWAPSLSLLYAFTSVDGHFSSYHSIQGLS